jgi:hypothetical protein
VVRCRILCRQSHKCGCQVTKKSEKLVFCLFRHTISCSVADPYRVCFWVFTDPDHLYDFLSLKNDVNVPSKSTGSNFFYKLLPSLTKIAGAGAGSGSVSQRWYGSADPYPYQNFTDPQHWLFVTFIISCDIMFMSISIFC